MQFQAPYLLEYGPMLTTLLLNLLWDFILPLITLICLRFQVRHYKEFQRWAYNLEAQQMEDEVNDQLVEQGKERSLKYDLRSHLSVPRSKLEYITTTTDSEAQGLPGSLNENDSMHFMSNDHMPRGTIKHSTGMTRAVHRVHTDQTVSPFHDFPLV